MIHDHYTNVFVLLIDLFLIICVACCLVQEKVCHDELERGDLVVQQLKKTMYMLLNFATVSMFSICLWLDLASLDIVRGGSSRLLRLMADPIYLWRCCCHAPAAASSVG